MVTSTRLVRRAQGRGILESLTGCEDQRFLAHVPGGIGLRKAVPPTKSEGGEVIAEFDVTARPLESATFASYPRLVSDAAENAAPSEKTRYKQSLAGRFVSVEEPRDPSTLVVGCVSDAEGNPNWSFKQHRSRELLLGIVPGDRISFVQCDSRLTHFLVVGGRDETAWNQLVDLYAPLVFARCRRRGLSPENASDVTQQVFEYLFRTLPKFERDESKGWLFQKWLMKNVSWRIADHYRKKYQEEGPASTAEPGGLRLSVDGDDDLTEAEKRALQLKAIEQVRANLRTDRVWQCFEDCVVKGRSPADVAADLNVTEQAVRRDKSRVLKRLKTTYAGLVDMSGLDGDP